MKLSMWTLYGWLVRRDYHPTAVISDGKPDLVGPRYLERTVPGSSTVSAIPASSVTGGAGYKTALSSNVDLVFVPDAEPAAVHNEIAQCFEFFNRWERDLLLALVEGGSLQDLLDVAHNVFQQPMFIKGDSSWVFAITPGYGPDTHPDWVNLERSAVNRTASFESVKTVSLDPEFQKVFLQRYPAIVKSPFYGGNVLRTNVWVDEHRVCEIVALEYGAPFNPGDTHLMQVFSDMVARSISANRSLYFSFSGLTDFFTGLLERRTCNPANLTAVQQATGWKEGESMVVAVVRDRAKCETPMLGVLREKLAEQLPYSCVFHYDGLVVCVINATRSKGYSATAAHLAELIPSDSFLWGASYDFLGLERLPDFYRQALTALKYAEENDHSGDTMYQAACSCIAEELKELPALQEYVHPDLRRLEDVDRLSESHYVRTLFEFLLCGGNYTDTAAHLGLHRNSLIYRMSRIQEIISSDLGDYQNRKLLLYSYLLVGRV